MFRGSLDRRGFVKISPMEEKLDLSRSAPWQIGLHLLGAGRTGSNYSRHKLEEFIRFHTDPVRFNRLFSGDSSMNIKTCKDTKQSYRKDTQDYVPAKQSLKPLLTQEMSHVDECLRKICPQKEMSSLPKEKGGRKYATKANSKRGVFGARRLLPVKVTTYEEVLVHWHRGVPGEVPPLKGMKISKRTHLRDYNLWHRRRAIALIHDAVGRDRFHLEFATTPEGKKRSFGDLTAYCIKQLKKVLHESTLKK